MRAGHLHIKEAPIRGTLTTHMEFPSTSPLPIVAEATTVITMAI